MAIRTMLGGDGGLASPAQEPTSRQRDEDFSAGAEFESRRSHSYDERPSYEPVEVSSEVVDEVEEAMVGSLIDQVESIYSERKALYEATGCYSIAEVLERIESLKSSISELADAARRRINDEHKLLDVHARKLA